MKQSRRWFFILTILSFCFMLLVVRLVQIQLVATENFSSRDINLIHRAIEQRQQKITLYSGRGEITDRYGQSLTGTKTYVMVAFPFVLQNDPSRLKLEQLAHILDLNALHLRSQLSQLKKPTVFMDRNKIMELSKEEIKEINKLNIKGIIGVPYDIRYQPEEMVAQHLIGYIAQNPDTIRQHYMEEVKQGLLTLNSEIGVFGLEKTFQPFLQSLGPTTLSYYIDALGNPLQGIDIKYAKNDNPFYPLVVQTTLDKDLQQYIEQVIDSNSPREGAIVVLDAETREILAMSSRPNFLKDVHKVQSWTNKAIKRYPPGSVFKIVIAAAALEEGIVTPNQPFQCHGVLEGTHFHCWRKEGHGKISFAEGFAKSCNIVFGQLAQKLGAEKIEEYAYKLGLLQKNGWNTEALYDIQNFKHLDGEEVGQVFEPNRRLMEREDPNYLLRTGIGQLDVQITPLAVANMLATIVNGGNKQQVKAVQNILYQTGTTFTHFDSQSLEGPTISPFTAYELQKLMALVVEEGTAEKLQNKEWSAAGKTGTAEVTSYANIEKNHQWFAGVYPRHQPRFVIVALSLHRAPSEPNHALMMFEDIVDWLHKNR